MQRCFSTLGCPHLSLDEALSLAERHALAAIEVRAVGGGHDIPQYLQKTYGEPTAFAAALKEHRPSVVALDTSFRLLGASPESRSELIEHVRWADAAGIRWLRAFDGNSTRALDGAVEEAGATLDWWAAEREQHGWQVDLMMETHDTFTTADRMQALLARVPSLAVLWDPHNMWRKGGEDPLEVWPVIRKNVVHVHVKDSVPDPSSKRGYAYVLPGDGEFPMKRLRERLSTDGYTGLLSLEWERLWHPELPPLDNALDAAARSNWW